MYYKEGWDTELLKTYPNLELDGDTTSLNEKLKPLNCSRMVVFTKKNRLSRLYRFDLTSRSATADEQNRVSVHWASEINYGEKEFKTHLH